MGDLLNKVLIKSLPADMQHFTVEGGISLKLAVIDLDSDKLHSFILQTSDSLQRKKCWLPLNP